MNSDDGLVGEQIPIYFFMMHLNTFEIQLIIN